LVVRPALREVPHELFAQPAAEELRSLYANARATLFPIRWPEPFGLVMIESMATGTPVIAFRNGSSPEVIEHGVTGWLCESVEEAVEAVARVDTLERTACRQRIRELFSAPIAVRKHEALYARLLGAAEPSRETIRDMERGDGSLEAQTAP
jgi:glycosyltransferase involved in cell wall biosynthesis